MAAPDVAAKMRAAAEQQKKSKLGTALYAFQQQKPGVLMFKKGDVLNILDDSRIDWWKAELNGQVGMVPAKYVQLHGAAAPGTAAPAAAAAVVAAPVTATPVAAPQAHNPVVAAQPAHAPAPVAVAAPVKVLFLFCFVSFLLCKIRVLLLPSLRPLLLPFKDWWRRSCSKARAQTFSDLSRGWR